jgi:hydrogenase/urease accessory protein HupE
VKSLQIGEKNVGMIDRVVRIILGIVLIGVFVLNMVAAPWSYLVALIGLIALVTGAIGTCPLYSLIGLNTLEKKL